MKAKGWRSKLKKATIAAGTYQPYFDTTIAALADVLEKRDAAEEQYIASGANPIIVYTNKNGSANPARNPMLALWMDLQSAALRYYNELGLTPAGRTKLGLAPGPITAGGKDDLFGD